MKAYTFQKVRTSRELLLKQVAFSLQDIHLSCHTELVCTTRATRYLLYAYSMHAYICVHIYSI